MKFGSVCSGIEAASVAWEPLGWKAAWFSEIEPFPCEVLKHHYPDVPNLGDMTALPQRISSGEIEAPDLFCGGTPCQAFSVAGLRKSLDDARGNLSLTFCEIANAIDNVRLAGGEHPAIIFWENVPGVLSTKDNAFGCFLAGLAGEDGAVEPPGGKWTNAGCVYGPQRAVAWRVLDAQYFGVAQRRKRVFVVASARDDFDPAAVLFEFDGVRRDTAPSREAGKGVAGGVEIGPRGGRLTDLNPTLDTRAKDGPIRNQLAGAVIQPFAVANCLTARMHKGINSTLDEGQTPVISIQDVTPREKAQNGKGWNDDGSAYTVDTHATQGVMQAIPIDTMNHVGRGDHHSFGDFEPGAPSYTLTKGHSHAVAQPVSVVAPTITAANNPSRSPQSSEVTQQVWAVMQATQPVAHCVDMGGNKGLNGGGILKELTQPIGTNGPHAISTAMQVRRLTPVECERLQGFPDGYTEIPWRKKPASECPDGPRYKALGNSWAVPVVRWIGKRIETEIKCKPNK